MSAIFSPCGRYRYRLERQVQLTGLLFAFYGVNPSKAGAQGVKDDQTTLKLDGFTLRNDGRGYVLGNPLAAIATNVRDIARMDDPVGPDNDEHLRRIVAEADVHVPCWGNLSKIPIHLWPHFGDLLDLLRESGKPTLTFGLTKLCWPKHPLMLSYATPLVPFR